MLYFKTLFFSFGKFGLIHLDSLDCSLALCSEIIKDTMTVVLDDTLFN